MTNFAILAVAAVAKPVVVAVVVARAADGDGQLQNVIQRQERL